MAIAKKLIAFALILLCFRTFAHTPVNQLAALNASFDKYYYAIEVEWDQVNTEQYKKINSEFKNEVKTLIENGLTIEELYKFVGDKLKNKNIAKDLNYLFEEVSVSEMSEEEAVNFISSYLEDTYSAGASWSGVAIVVNLGVLAVILVSLLPYLRYRCGWISSEWTQADIEEYVPEGKVFDPSKCAEFPYRPW
jgi:hypothetical protein